MSIPLHKTNPMSDELIAQLVNPDDATLSAGSNVPVQWQCPKDPRHIWTASPNTRKHSPNCSVCTNKTIIPGVNDLATSHPNLSKELVDPNIAIQYHSGSHHKPFWRCQKGHEWPAEIVSRTRLDSGCPMCSGRLPIVGETDLATLRPDVAALLVDPNEAKTVTVGSGQKLLWQCQDNPDHQWKTEVRNRTQKNTTGCRYCTNRTFNPTRNPTLKAINSPLLDEVVDKKRAEKLTTGSGIELEWKCTDCRKPHTYFMPVRKRIAGQGCPVKAGIQVLAGINDLATTHPDLAKQAVNQELVTQISKGFGEPIEWQCQKENHTWKALVYSRIAGNGCVYCAGKAVLPGFNDLATTHSDLAKELTDQTLATQLSFGSNTPVSWQCNKYPNHTWITSPNARIGLQTGCPICTNKKILSGFNDLQTTHPELAKELVDQSLATTLSAGSGTLVSWQCPKHTNHTWNSSPITRISMKTKCPICTNKKVLPGYNDIATTHPNFASQLLDPKVSRTITAKSSERVNWICEEGHIWNTLAYQRTIGFTGCPKCQSSQPQKDLLEILQTLLPNEEIITNDRSILKGKELDIVIPGKNIAIEFNGLFWHNETAGKDSTYHQNKTQQASKAGYQLIHIWEDDWNLRNDIVIRALAHRLGANQHLLEALPNLDPKATETHYARKLTAFEPQSSEVTDFYNLNHIQGAVSTTRSFALKDKNNIARAMLSLRSPRHNARMNRKVGQWEIQRYATFGNIPGGFSKLLKHAERILIQENIELNQWISFSDNALSDGGMYKKTDFTIDAVLRPDYKYAGNSTNWQRAPKEAFQKKRFRDDPELIYEDDLTEKQLANLNDLHRIWDSGKIRWVKQVTS